MAKRKLLSEAKTSLYVANDEEFESLIHRPEWGAFDFEQIRRELTWLRQFSRQIVNLVPDNVPEAIYRAALDSRSQIQTAVDLVDKFTVDSSSPRELHGQIISTVKRLTQEVFSGQGPALLTLSASDSRVDVQGQIEEFKTSLQTKALEVQELVTTTKEHLVQISADAEAALESARASASAAEVAARENAVRTGVSVHEVEFQNEVSELSKARIVWLAASASLGLCAILLAYFLGQDPLKEGDYLAAVQRGITKVFIVGSFVTASVWCASNYRALSHQLSVNRHRMNALRTFKTFAQAAETPEVRQAILLETTRTIFGSSPTGYLPANESNSDTNSKSAEILLKAAKGSS